MFGCRIHVDALKTLKWWAIQVDDGIALGSVLRLILEGLADDIIDSYDVTNNTCGVTVDDLKSRVYREFRYVDRHGRARYPRGRVDVDI